MCCVECRMDGFVVVDFASTRVTRLISDHPTSKEQYEQMTSSPTLQAQRVKHKTLSAYYPSILRLEDCFEATITRESDSTDYIDFTHGTLCAIRAERITFPIKDDSTAWICIPTSQRRSQQECVDWVMSDIARQGSPNILLKRDRVGQAFLLVLITIVCRKTRRRCSRSDRSCRFVMWRSMENPPG